MGKIHKLLLSIALFCVFFGTSKTTAQALTITWDGGGSTNNWSECANWDNTNTCPGASDAVVFSGTSTKDATVDSSFTGTITSLSINSGYTGTITMARSLSITTTFTQAAGTFTAANQTLDVDTTFTLSAGTFTASSGTTFIGGALTVSGSPTFNHNSGTVTFDGTAGVTLSCNSVTFNLVTFAHTTNTKTVSSNCTLPLGSSPTLATGNASTAITLNGTMSGTGTLTTGILTLNSGAALSGFSGIVAGSNLTVAGATVNFGSYTTVDLNGALIISSGSFTAPTGTMTLASALTITGSPTFNANGGTISFDGTVSGALACNNVTFNLVTFTHTSSTKTVNSDCSMPLGNNPTLGTGTSATGVTVNGTLSGTGTLTAGVFAINSGGTLSGFTGIVGGSTFTVSGATLNLGSYTTVDFNSTFALSSGTFTAPSGTMTLAGALTITGGTFNANGGTVSFDGATSGTLACNNVTFNVVTFAHTTNTKTVNSDCNLPLGNNPTLGTGNGSTAVILNGTLSGTGTLTTGIITLNSGAVLSGFTGISGGTNSNFTVNGATVNLSSYTTVDFNGALIISSGSFTAPTGTMTLAGALTISGSPTFNANGGTLTIDGSTATLSCNNVTFNLVTFNHTAAKTISSNCSMPLGANPILDGTAAGSITLSGTLSGSGTLTKASGTGSLTLNSGATLSGFSGLVTNTLIISGATLDLSSYSPVTIGLSFTLSSGSFTAPTGTMTVASGFTVSGSSTFNANGGTVTFDGSGTATLSCNNITFNLVTFNHTTAGSSRTVSSNCSLPLGANPTIPNAISLSGTISGSGTLNFTGSNTTIISSTGVLSGFSGINHSSGGFTLSGATLDLSNYNPVTFTVLTISSGTFTAPSGTMTVTNNFAHTGGTFNHNNGTFIWQNASGNAGTRTISGSTTFNNFSILSNGLAQTKNFTAGTTQTIDGTLTIQGSSGNLLTLRSSSTGTQWNIIPHGNRIIEYVDVQDSANLDGRPLNGSNGTITDSGNNTGWIFSRPEISGISLGNREYVNTDRVTFTWAPPSTQDSFSKIDHYKLEVDNGSAEKNFTVDNIPANRTSDYETSTFIAHYANFEDNDLSNNRISVTTKHSDDWGQNQNNDGKLEEGEKGWSLTVVDTAGGTQQYHQSVLVDRTAPGIQISQVNTIGFKDPFTTSDTTPTFFGRINDGLTGTQSDRKVAAGPNEVRITIEKQQTKNRAKYDFISEKTVPIQEIFWASDNTKVNDNNQNLSDKFSPFSFTPEKNLSSGTYRITFSGVDKVGNVGGTQSFQIRVAPSRTVFLTTSSAKKNVLGESDENLTPLSEDKELSKVEITPVEGATSAENPDTQQESDNKEFSETELGAPAEPLSEGSPVKNISQFLGTYWFVGLPIGVLLLLLFLWKKGSSEKEEQ